VLRLPGYDYKTAGGYFVTVCTQDRTGHFGSVEDDAVTLSTGGSIV